MEIRKSHFYDRLKFNLLIYITIALFFCCNNINETIVLKIGNVDISKHTYEREQNKLLKNNSEAETNNEIIEKWKRNLIDNCFFICDAYQLHYDTIRAINKKLELISDIMMVQKYGYLWKETVSPIVNEYMKITDSKWKKRKRMFYFDYISCTNLDSLKIILIEGDTLRNKDQYVKLKSLCTKYFFLHNNYVSLQWPFIPFHLYRDKIIEMKEQQVSLPLHIDSGIYYLYLDHSEEVDINSEDQSEFSKELQFCIEDEINRNKDKEMITSGKFTLYEKNINKISNYLSSGLKLENFNENVLLMEYEMNNQIKIVDFNTFINYQILNPYGKIIKSPNEFVEELKQFYFNDYLRNEAQKLGLYSRNEFMMDKDYYKKKLILNEYFQREFIPKIKIDSSEVLKYYYNNLSEVTIPECAVIDLFFFKDISYANKYLENNLSIKVNDNLSIHDINAPQGMIGCNIDTIIDFRNTELAQEICKKIKDLRNNSILPEVVSFRGKNALIFKKDLEHNYVINFSKAKKKIEKKIFDKALFELKSNRLNELKRKYQIEINRIGTNI